MIKQRLEFSQQLKKKKLISEDQIHQKLKSLHMFDIKMGIKSILLVKEIQQHLLLFSIRTKKRSSNNSEFRSRIGGENLTVCKRHATSMLTQDPKVRQLQKSETWISLKMQLHWIKELNAPIIPHRPELCLDPNTLVLQ